MKIRRLFARGLVAFEAAILLLLATSHHVAARPGVAVLLLAPLVVLGLMAFGVAYRQRMIKTALAALLLQCGLLIYVFASIYSEYGMLDAQGQPVYDRAATLYFSIVTWTTLGYGDLRPLPELRLVAAAEALLGYLHMGLLVPLIWWLLTEHGRPTMHTAQRELEAPHAVRPLPERHAAGRIDATHPTHG